MQVPISAFLTLVLVILAAPCSAMPTYLSETPPEKPADAQARHARVAARRAGPVVICHRGASAFAPENTLEAYAAAMDYGADGCEIDPRRTADGVIVLFHDDMLENLTDGFGAAKDFTYHELSQLSRRGAATGTKYGIPTLASLLVLARQRAMLLHLDLKEPGLEHDVAKMIDEADMWDHVVAVNTNNGASLLASSKLKQLIYKAPGLYEDGSDVDIDATKAALARPGDMIIVDDPRVATLVLKRPPYQPVPLPKGLTKRWPVSHAKPPALSETAAQILARAQAADKLGKTGKKTKQVVKQLEDQVEHRTLDRDWRYHGLDGAAAARALGRLQAIESAPMLAKKLMTVAPDLAKAANPQYPNTPVPFYDWRIKGAIVDTLGELVCDTSRQALLDYVALDEAEARKLGVPLFTHATRSLLHQKLSTEQIESLLRSSSRAVRGTAVLWCLDHPTAERTAALKAAAPWALTLPRASTAQ